jgi:hypothetical protein
MCPFFIRRPNGPDHTHIVIFVLCLHGPNYFVATFALGCPTDPIKANIFSVLPFFELTRMLVRLDHVSRFIRSAAKSEGLSRQLKLTPQ